MELMNRMTSARAPPGCTQGTNVSDERWLTARPAGSAEWARPARRVPASTSSRRAVAREWCHRRVSTRLLLDERSRPVGTHVHAVINDVLQAQSGCPHSTKLSGRRRQHWPLDSCSACAHLVLSGWDSNSASSRWSSSVEESVVGADHCRLPDGGRAHLDGCARRDRDGDPAQGAARQQPGPHHPREGERTGRRMAGQHVVGSW